MTNKLTPPTDTWNLTPLYLSDDDPKIKDDRKVVEKAVDAFAAKWGKTEAYLTSLDDLFKALTEYEHLRATVSTEGDEGLYLFLRTSQDQDDPKLKGMQQSFTEFSLIQHTKIQFFELKLAKLDADLQTKVLADGRFKPYHHFLERLFAEAKYLLSEPEERIVNLLTDTSYHRWVGMTSEFLSAEERETLQDDGKRKKVNYESLLGLLSSSNAEVRDEAAKNLNEILRKHAKVAEAEINAVLAYKKAQDDLRGFKRPDASRHLSDDIDSAVVDQLLDTVTDHNQVAQRYYRLKADLLGKKQLAYHERNVEYGSVDQDYDFEAAAELVHHVCKRLDPEFADTFERFIANGQFDLYPRQGKSGGAFCVYNLLPQPTYILLNFTNKLRDVTTLAHEFGHGMNDELMRAKQNSLNFGTPMATAEVASQFLEDFVLDELAANADDELKLSLNLSRLNDAISSIFRQIACYRFEQDLHTEFRNTGFLSLDDIGKLFMKNMAAYMGDAVEQSDGSENWWVYWSHIRTFFYVYSYGGGLLIAKAMQAKVRENPRFISDVKKFLAAGRSKSPKDLFADLGIEITDRAFWEAGIADFDRLLTETEDLAKKLGKIKA